MLNYLHSIHMFSTKSANDVLKFSAEVDLCPDIFWIIASGTPASKRVVAPVALRLWFMKFP